MLPLAPEIFVGLPGCSLFMMLTVSSVAPAFQLPYDYKLLSGQCGHNIFNMRSMRYDIMITRPCRTQVAWPYIGTSLKAALTLTDIGLLPCVNVQMNVQSDFLSGAFTAVAY